MLFDLLDDDTDEEPKSKYQEERQQVIRFLVCVPNDIKANQRPFGNERHHGRGTEKMGRRETVYQRSKESVCKGAW